MSFDYDFSGGGGLRFVGFDDFKLSNVFSFASNKYLINLPQKKIEKNRFQNLFQFNIRIIQQKYKQIFGQNKLNHIHDTYFTQKFDY